MRAIVQAFHRYLTSLPGDMARGWDRFWFTPADPTTLGAIRIMTGVILLYIHLTCIGELMNYLGPDGWIDSQAMQELRKLTYPSITPGKKMFHLYSESIWFYVQDPVWIWALQGLFLLATVLFTIGLYSRVANVIVWAGHLSYIHRGYTAWFGMDAILAMITFYLLFGPTDSALSVRQWLKNRRAARLGLRPTPPAPSWTANLAIRLIQIHMCIVYFCAGMCKLQGATWWSGRAVWYTMMLYDFALIDMKWLGHLPAPVFETISGLGVAFTIGFEVGFPFLIWNRRWRPWFLAMALLLHAGIGLFMGLGGFGAIMLTGCLAFVPPESLRWFLNALVGGHGGNDTSDRPMSPISTAGGAAAGVAAGCSARVR